MKTAVSRIADRPRGVGRQLHLNGKKGQQLVEQLRERKRESEPQETVYDQHMKLLNEKALRRAGGRVVIRAAERPFEQNRQSFIKSMLNVNDWDSVGVPYWSVFIQTIKTHSGKHTHQGSVLIFVLDGKGYTTVDGVRYDWEKGDLILLPIKPGGCEHQHFNEDPNKPAVWMGFWFLPMYEAIGNTVVQREEHPDWRKTK